MHSRSLFRSIAIVLIAGLIVCAPALAQVAVPPGGITVTGQGRASAPADATTFQMTFSGGFPEGPPGWQPFGTPGAGNIEQVRPVIDALVAAGLPEGDITVTVPPYIGNGAYGPYGPVSAVMGFTIDAPDTGRIREIIDAANGGASESMLLLGEVIVVHTVADCTALYDEATANAFEDARRRANRQGDILGLTVSDVTDSRDTSAMFLQVDPFSAGQAGHRGCSYSPASAITYAPYGPLPYDLTMEPEVVVIVTMEVTFEATAPDRAATPQAYGETSGVG